MARAGRERDAFTAASDRTDARASIMTLPFVVGPYELAIEATRLIEVRAGAAVKHDDDPARPVSVVDLHALLRAPSRGAVETIVARGDDGLGRTPGPRVAFAVDGTKPLRRVPLETLRPLPPLLADTIETDVIVAIVESQDELAFLLDPARLLRAAAGDRTRSR